MTISTHSARITGPVTYQAANGGLRQIPLGPCLVELADGSLVDIIWGNSGQRCAALPTVDVAAAQQQGHLVLLD